MRREAQRETRNDSGLRSGVCRGPPSSLPSCSLLLVAVVHERGATVKGAGMSEQALQSGTTATSLDPLEVTQAPEKGVNMLTTLVRSDAEARGMALLPRTSTNRRWPALHTPHESCCSSLYRQISGVCHSSPATLPTMHVIGSGPANDSALLHRQADALKPATPYRVKPAEWEGGAVRLSTPSTASRPSLTLLALQYLSLQVTQQCGSGQPAALLSLPAPDIEVARLMLPGKCYAIWSQILCPLPPAHCLRPRCPLPLPTAHCSHPTTHCSVLGTYYSLFDATTLCSPLPARCSLFTVHCSLLTAHCSLLTSHFSKHTAHCSLLTAHFSLLKAHCSLLTAHCALRTAHCALLTAHCSLLTSQCPTSHSLRPTAHHSLTAYYSLLTAHYSLLSSHCSLLTSQCPTSHSFR